MKTFVKPTSEATSKPAVEPATNRRRFLLGATLGSAGAVAAVVAGGNAAEVLTTSAPAKEAAKPKGYHVTAHIEQYYETTRI